MEKKPPPPSSPSSSPKPKLQPKPVPSDVIYDIFTKLPVKSLMRFRCVSKVCSSYISTPSFAKLHALHFPVKPTGLLITCPARLQSAQNFFSVHFDGGFALPLMTIPPRFSRYTTHSVNGLICMDFGLYATICNPSTRQIFNLPFVINSTTSPSANSTYFCVNSFGFDPVCKTYKVLNAWAVPEKSPAAEYRVFQLGTNSWRSLNGGPDYYPQRGNICIDGILYFRSWVSTHTNHGTVLVAFDLHEESFRVIKIHQAALVRGNESELIVFSRRPAIANHLLVEDDSIRIWVLDESTESERWVKFTMPIPETYFCDELLDEEMDYFVDCINNGDTDELLLVPQKLLKSVYVIYFDVVNRSMRRAEIFGLPEYRLSDLSSNTIRVTNYEENIMPFT